MERVRSRQGKGGLKVGLQGLTFVFIGQAEEKVACDIRKLAFAITAEEDPKIAGLTVTYDHSFEQMSTGPAYRHTWVKFDSGSGSTMEVEREELYGACARAMV